MFSLHPGFLIILQSKKVYLPSILKKTHTPLVFSITDLGRRWTGHHKIQPQVCKIGRGPKYPKFLVRKVVFRAQSNTHTHKKKKSTIFFFGVARRTFKDNTSWKTCLRLLVRGGDALCVFYKSVSFYF